MGYVVDRVVICDAYREPDCHYEILPGGRSRRAEGRRPSKRYLVGGREARRGIAGVVGEAATLFDEQAAANEERNEFVNELRAKVREWRMAGWPGTALVTRRLLEWWFEREEERASVGKRLFFCQQEAIETLVYLYEVEGRRKMPETGHLLRYALKLATGTGKTVVMALVVVWSTLHKRKVSGSPLSGNFLVLVPNLTVRSRVSGQPRGDGLDPGGAQNLYDAFDLVPPEYRDEFRPNVVVRNWQSIPLEGKRDDWMPEEVVEAGRFIPAAVLRAMRRRAQQDPDAVIRRTLGGWRDLVVINDEAHHVYGEKRTRAGEEPDYIKWSHILERISRASRVGLVVDLSATPWYGAGSAKPEGTLFEWLVSDFSVYDAFESGLVKVVRLPDPSDAGHTYLDLWDRVRGAKTENEYILACKGAIASIYAAWKKDFNGWRSSFDFGSSPSPVLLCIADNATRAKWLFNHLTREYELLRNPTGDDVTTQVTIQVDSKVFDADRGVEATFREMADTVGKKGKPGENVRCIVSVNMLSEGWDVKSVTHILGLRAFGSPLLTEQVVGRGLRRTSYDVLNEPLAERPEGSDETVDAFGIPFVGFPVERRKRPQAGTWNAAKPLLVEPDPKKDPFAVRVPNVRAWAVGLSDRLAGLVDVTKGPAVVITEKETPPEVHVKPVVGGRPEAVLTLDEFRAEWPLLKSEFLLAQELFDRTNPATAADEGYGPTFEEILEVVRLYVAQRVSAKAPMIREDVGMYFWRMRALDALEHVVRDARTARTRPVPIAGDPEVLDTRRMRKFHWTGIVADGKKCHLGRVPCHSPLEKAFADFLDRAPDVVRYLKNERFGFSVTYYEAGRPRQYFPDFVVVVKERDGREVTWLAETKGEIRPNTALKSAAAVTWCERMSLTAHGPWRYQLVSQRPFEASIAAGVKTLEALVRSLVVPVPSPQLSLVPLDDERVKRDRFKTLLPLYSLKAAAGAFGQGEDVEPEGWVEAAQVGPLDERMFVARVVGRSMEPTLHDGEYAVFRANPTGTRYGKVVLAQYRGPADPETGGSYTVKRYRSDKVTDGDGGWRHTRIVLEPDNRAFTPIVVPGEDAVAFRIVAELHAVLSRTGEN